MLANIISTIAHVSSSNRRSSSSSSNDIDEDATNAQLNEYLETLVEVFPEADIADIRERLLKSSVESRLFLVTESMLIIPSRGGRPNAKPKIETAEKFRSRQYQITVKNLLQNEFKGLSKSTIQAVMIENNHDYRKTRATLTEIASKSWRFSVSAFFRRKKPEQPAITPPEPQTSGCEELDAELRELGKDKIEAQIAKDREVSVLLDEAEHAAASELVACETCYGDYSWNEIAACSVGHFICYGCLRRSVQENLYGQGQSMIGARSSVRCISATASPTCEACIPPEILEKVIPEDMLRAMEDKSATENLDRSGINLVRCPFCSYAEVDEIQPYRIHSWAKAAGACTLLLSYAYIPVPTILAFVLLFLFTYFTPFLARDSNGAVVEAIRLISLNEHWKNTVRRIQLKRRGALFKCRNDRCKRESCIQCCKEWTAFHKCFEKEEDNVRIHVEKAMANAVKRTCPICRISFVKSEGCNKLTCVCGYIMCYICRSDIRKEGYKHFCQHFRQVPGTACAECDKCDLYVQQDEEAAIREAAMKAEEEYFKSHDVPATWRYGKEKVGPIKRNNSLIQLDLHHVQKYTDWILEMVIEDTRDPIVQF